jgi:hypothetical protein
VGLALLIALALSTPTDAQEWPSGVSFNASVGPSFANLGPSFSTTAALDYSFTDRLAIGGEFGILPHAPVDDAPRLVTLPTSTPSGGRLHTYHSNMNVKVRPYLTSTFRPYVTAGLGTFTADAVAQDPILGGMGEIRRIRTDFATNVGAGALYRLNDWLGVQADYRTFFIHRDDDALRVHRVATGLAFGTP